MPVDQLSLIDEPPSIGRVYRFRVHGEPMQYRNPHQNILLYKWVTPKYLVAYFFGKKKRQGKLPIIVHQHPDDRVVEWYKAIRLQIESQISREYPEIDGAPLRGTIWMRLWVYIPRPISNKDVYPITKSSADRTNYLKAAEDALRSERKKVGDRMIETQPALIIEDDCLIVSGPPELRWAFGHYPDDPQTEQEPGLIYEVAEIDTSETKEFNQRYKQTLEEKGWEYRKVMRTGKKSPEWVLRAKREEF